MLLHLVRKREQIESPTLLVEIDHCSKHIAVNTLKEIVGRNDGHHVNDHIGLVEKCTEHSPFEVDAVRLFGQMRRGKEAIKWKGGSEQTTSIPGGLHGRRNRGGQ